ncbi:MAG: ClbS/DfsB family four-helix bundle protein [Anaerolineaceae bacterium]
MKRDLQADKAALLSAFTENRQAIFAIARGWPTGKEQSIFIGEWSILDLLAHMSGWHEAYLEAFTALRNGKPPEFYAHKDADWRSYNALLVKKYRRPTLAEQIALLQTTFGKLFEALNQMEVNEFFRDSGVRYRGYKLIISRLVESELKDERVHLQQMRAWLAVIS